MAVFEDRKYWLEKGRAAVDRKHPQGGLSDEGQFAPSQRTERGEGNFHAPADRAAFDKIFCEIADAIIKR